MKKWKERNRRQKFVFDILDDSFDVNDENTLYYARNSGERKINQALAVVGEKIGLNIRLTFKVARHTFATLALSDGLSISVVSRLLGHSSTPLLRDTARKRFSRGLSLLKPPRRTVSCLRGIRTPRNRNSRPPCR